MRTFLNKVEIGVNSDVVWFSWIPDGVMDQEVVVDGSSNGDDTLDVVMQGC